MAASIHRFEREARLLAKLSHPNVVAVYDFGLAGKFLYFTMDFVDGSSLRQMLKSKRLIPSEAVKLFLQLCDGLQHAHQSGVIHRDIKPENLLVDKEAHLKIADLGLAKLIGGADASNEWKTPNSRRMGTLHYMAPEQFESPQAVDHRADIYSAGVVLYEMLTGELPLGRFPAPSEKAKVDSSLDKVLFRALEKDPARRYQDIGEFKQAVEAVFPLSSPASQKFHQSIDDFQEAVNAVVFNKKGATAKGRYRSDLERKRQGLAKLLRENPGDMHLKELIWKEFERICDQLNDEEERVWACLGLAGIYQQQRRLAEAILEGQKLDVATA